jgi:hypothetical protein
MTRADVRELNRRMRALWELVGWVKRVRIAMWVLDVALIVALVLAAQGVVAIAALTAVAAVAVLVLGLHIALQLAASRRLERTEAWVREHGAGHVDLEWPPS